ncbi:MAG: hypothetical protein GWP07_02440 [Xanthomonadaceae bacterium]|nr:hypothetical protein [Xanthomonadaceae bacterium]
MSNNQNKRIRQFVKDIKARKWAEINWDKYVELLQYPLSEQLHNEFTSADEKLLLELAGDRDAGPLGRNFGLRLLAYIRSSRVKEFFWRKWEEAEKNADYKLMMEFLCWRLTDYVDLDEKQHRRIFKAVMNYFDHFKQQFIFFVGGDSGKVLTVVRQRLMDDRFPDSKHWLYLCAACAAPETQRRELRDLLKQYEDKGDFAGEVVRQLLKNMGG